MTDDEYETLHRLLDGEPENEPGGKIVEQVEAMVGRLRDENERLAACADAGDQFDCSDCLSSAAKGGGR